VAFHDDESHYRLKHHHRRDHDDQRALIQAVGQMPLEEPVEAPLQTLRGGGAITMVGKACHGTKLS
jgi:hypothetical protein